MQRLGRPPLRRQALMPAVMAYEASVRKKLAASEDEELLVGAAVGGFDGVHLAHLPRRRVTHCTLSVTLKSCMASVAGGVHPAPSRT